MGRVFTLKTGITQHWEILPAFLLCLQLEERLKIQSDKLGCFLQSDVEVGWQYWCCTLQSYLSILPARFNSNFILGRLQIEIITQVDEISLSVINIYQTLCRERKNRR